MTLAVYIIIQSKPEKQDKNQTSEKKIRACQILN